MVKYIIKINCTRKNDLAFNNKDIVKKKRNVSQNPSDLTLGNISCIFPNIKSIKILYKTFIKNNNDNELSDDDYTTKTLEFYYENDDELSDDDFIHFIEVLKKLGFHSENNTKVRYVKIINDIDGLRQKHVVSKIIYFTSLKKIKIVPQKGPRKPNRSKYMTELLYICKNLTV